MERMYLFFSEFLQEIGLKSFVSQTAYGICIALIAFTCIISRFFVRYLVIRIFTGIAKRAKFEKFNIFLNNKLFNRLSYLVFPVTISIFTSDISDHYMIWNKISGISFIVIILFIINSGFKCVNEFYSYHKLSKTYPIRSLLQVFEIVAIIVGGIISISIVINTSPTAIIGSVGAMTAIITLVFKDTILGFIAGIQLTSNDMIRIGDWIEVPKYSADGTVVDISVTTVKVQNFDKTITSIPAYNLVSDAFINWRGMENTGARRIKRSFCIDVSGVKICDVETLEKFKNIAFLENYLNEKLSEINEYNSKLDYDTSNPINGRQLTNIGVFRIYINKYLKNHPCINKEFPLMVRQLEAKQSGIPLEIYAFTNTAVWVDYEGIQSDIFDHIYAVIPEFGLKIYQNPSSGDFLQLK